LTKFSNRLTPSNLIHLKRLTIFLTALNGYCAEWKSMDQKEKVEVLTVSDLMLKLEHAVKDVNLLEIELYLRNSQVRAFNRGPPLFSINYYLDCEENIFLF
jgi:chromosome transmission fidelity protein 1